MINKKKLIIDDPKEFVMNDSISPEDLIFHPDTDGKQWQIDRNAMLLAMMKTNRDIYLQIRANQRWERKGMPSLLNHIPPKNLSGAIGECLGSNYCGMVKCDIRKNPHESGSPDFLPFFSGTEEWITNPKKDAYTEGGFDAKGSKISNMKFMEVDASSHHDQTRTILVAAWIEHKGMPQIVGSFYTNKLKTSDWRRSKNSENEEASPGGQSGNEPSKKITNSAILLYSGLLKLRVNWIVLHKSVILPHRNNDIEKYGLHPLRMLQESNSTSTCS